MVSPLPSSIQRFNVSIHRLQTAYIRFTDVLASSRARSCRDEYQASEALQVIVTSWTAKVEEPRAHLLRFNISLAGLSELLIVDLTIQALYSTALQSRNFVAIAKLMS